MRPQPTAAGTLTCQTLKTPRAAGIAGILTGARRAVRQFGWRRR